MRDIIAAMDALDRVTSVLELEGYKKLRTQLVDLYLDQVHLLNRPFDQDLESA